MNITIDKNSENRKTETDFGKESTFSYHKPSLGGT